MTVTHSGGTGYGMLWTGVQERAWMCTAIVPRSCRSLVPNTTAECWVGRVSLVRCLLLVEAKR